MPNKDKTSKCPFSTSKKRKRRASKKFNAEQRKILAESDKGSYYHQERLPSSASSKKIKIVNNIEESTVKSKYDKPSSLTIIDSSYINGALQNAAACKICQESLEIVENTDNRLGLGTVWAFRCCNVKCSKFEHPSEFYSSKKSGYIYDVNISANVGMRAIGRGCSGANKLFSIMNIKEPVSSKPWAKHTEGLNQAVMEVLGKEFKDAAWQSKLTQRQLNQMNCNDEELAKQIIDVGVSLDCSWSSRGWSATDGMVAAIDVNTGLVLDVIHLYRSCPTCKKLEESKINGTKTKKEFYKAMLAHDDECLLNHEGSAAAMESAGVLTLYKRSNEKGGLRYIPYIGDGDSSGYSAVEIAKPYGPAVFIPKEECVSHITKRMGSNLRNLIKEYKGRKLGDGKVLSGKGRLTQKRMNAMQNFYGQAIRRNKGDSNAMAQATRAILKHYSSTIEKPNHDDCPKGASSWCSYQREKATKIKQYKPIKNPFTPAMVEVMSPLFNRLSDERLLSGCEKCYTQNTNESLHHVVWGMAPKEQYNSTVEIDTAVMLGVLQYNKGFKDTYAQVLPELGLNVTQPMISTWEKIDKQRVYQGNYRATKIVKTRRKKKKGKKLAAQDAFLHQEGVQYKSQSF